MVIENVLYDGSWISQTYNSSSSAPPPPNFRPKFIVAKRLNGWSLYLAWRYASAQATLCLPFALHSFLKPTNAEWRSLQDSMGCSVSDNRNLGSCQKCMSYCTLHIARIASVLNIFWTVPIPYFESSSRWAWCVPVGRWMCAGRYRFSSCTVFST